MNWETEHYTYVLKLSVSFLGIHKGEPDICIGFSPALHLQCAVVGLVVDPVLLSALEELVGSHQGAPAGPSQAWLHHCKYTFHSYK